MKRGALVAMVLALAVAVTATTGCTRVRLENTDEPSGVTAQNKTVPLEGAEKLDARIRMGAGELTMDSGPATGTVEAEFRVTPSSWRPDVGYSVDGTTGVLSVEQPSLSERSLFGDTHNEWSISLPANMPVDLDVEVGAGESTLDLHSVDVGELDVLAGVGQCTVDLSGPRTHDVTARIETGLGELKLRVPENVGVRLTTPSEGIGDFTAPGFSAEDGYYVNDAYATSTVKMEIGVHQGVGSIEVVTVK